MQSLITRTYLAHLGLHGKEQTFSEHLLNVSSIASRLAAKIGMRRAGELIGLATT